MKKIIIVLAVFMMNLFNPSFAIKVGLQTNVSKIGVGASVEAVIIDANTNKSVCTIDAMKGYEVRPYKNKIAIKYDGKYYKIDRPYTAVTGEMWISASYDLVHWGEFKPLLAPNYRFWNATKIGPTPPIKTSKGWLEIMHGAFTPAGGRTYYLGAILLDLEEPWKIIGKTNSYILAPETPEEQHGNSDNTVFVCGAIADEATDELTIYYGGCDKYICMAQGSLSEMIDACIREI